MSGICGLFNLDGKPVAEAELRAMTSMLARRGPDKTGRWKTGPVGLGHTLLATTPELQFEQQPFAHSESGCVITADVRLDNREELIARLAPGRHADAIGDAGLILAAYLEWGEDCPNHLLGDFAFSLWDAREKRLFGARDHSGMRPYYYHHEKGKLFAFASAPRAMLVLPQVPYAINQGRIADFLVEELEWLDYTSTFFEGVQRLPPGHRLSVTASTLKIAEYWRPEPGADPGNRSDDEWREGFLDVFTKAVDARLSRAPDLTGSMLSGGMDSGSVVAVAKDLINALGDGPLHTYSATANAGPDHEEYNEVRAIEAAISMDMIAPTVVHAESLHEAFEAMVADLEEPFDGQCMLLKAVYRVAAADGRRVVIDGAGGDVVLHTGSRIVRLLRSGHLVTALREIARESAFWESGSLARDIYRYTRSAIAPEPVKWLHRQIRGRRRAASLVKRSLISPAFAKQVNLGERVERDRQMIPAGWIPDYAVECSKQIRPNMTGGRERYARLAAASAVEASDPFMDRRVIEFCLRLPGHLRLRDGWHKIILRDLMQGRLPDEVRWARGKHHLGWVFNDAVTRAAAARAAITIESLHGTLGGYVDAEKLTGAWQAIGGGSSPETIHTAHMLASWLQENERRPVVSG